MYLRSVQRFAPVVLAVAFIGACGGSAPAYKMEASSITGPPCEHLDSPYSEYMCRERDATIEFKPADVTAETLVVHTADNRNIRLAMPNRTDAIFLSESAIETFLLRHYDATDSTKARKLRAHLDSVYHH